MWVQRTFKVINVECMTWKSTSSSGWEYLVCVRGLGFESYVCYFFCVIKRVVDFYNNLIILISMKHEVVELVRHWVGMYISVGSNLGRPKWNFVFAIFSLIWSWRVKGNPSRNNSQG